MPERYRFIDPPQPARYRWCLAVLSGLLLTLAFPKNEVPGLAWCALMPLFWAVRTVSGRDAFRIGWVSGLVHYLSLIYWTAYTMHTFGHLPWAVCIPVLFLFAAFLALFSALFGWWVNRFASRPLWLALLAPAAWTALEFLRGNLLTGFPWALLAHSQYRMLPLIQMVDLAGTYGLSFIICGVNTALFLITRSIIRISPAPRLPWRYSLPAGLAAALLLGCAWGYGHWRLGHWEQTAAAAAGQRTVAVIQGNVDQGMKWDEAFRQATIERYLRLTREAAAGNPDLVVWPETATPFYFGLETAPTRAVLEGLLAIRRPLLLGSPAVSRTAEGDRYYNRAYLLDGAGRIQSMYDKAHLVPFGEYVPLKRWLPFVGKMVAQVGDFHAGKPGAVIDWEGVSLGIQICYEAIFPELARAQVASGAQLLVNMTNDAWYGPTGAPHQLLAMTVFRAVENRRSLARAANTGISGFISPTGRILAPTALYQEAAVSRALPLVSSYSAYTQWGDTAAYGCLIICALAGVLLLFRFRGKAL